jgi:hypothetical protein
MIYDDSHVGFERWSILKVFACACKSRQLYSDKATDISSLAWKDIPFNLRKINQTLEGLFSQSRHFLCSAGT